MHANRPALWMILCSVALAGLAFRASADDLGTAPATVSAKPATAAKGLLDLPGTALPATPSQTKPAPIAPSPPPASGIQATAPSSAVPLKPPAAPGLQEAAPASPQPPLLPAVPPSPPTPRMPGAQLPAIPSASVMPSQQAKLPALQGMAPASPADMQAKLVQASLPATAKPAGDDMPSQNLSPADLAVAAKNPDVLFVPLHLADVSLLFKKSDNDLIREALEMYDKYQEKQTQAVQNKDDLTSLLDSLKSQKITPQDQQIPPPLPNVYLGSIVYYSPDHWSIWVNGRKITDKNNASSQEFYVSGLSRTEVELTWRPASLQETPVRYARFTDHGANPLPHIVVDDKKGIILLHLRPNQTFLPRTLAIVEGLVKSPPVPGVATDTPAAAQNKTPPTGKDIMEHPLSTMGQR